MDTELGYDKGEKAGKSADNRRNGHSTKTVRSEYGEIDRRFRGIGMVPLSPQSSRNIRRALLALRIKFLPFMPKG